MFLFQWMIHSGYQSSWAAVTLITDWWFRILWVLPNGAVQKWANGWLLVLMVELYRVDGCMVKHKHEIPWNTNQSLIAHPHIQYKQPIKTILLKRSIFQPAMLVSKRVRGRHTPWFPFLQRLIFCSNTPPVFGGVLVVGMCTLQNM